MASLEPDYQKMLELLNSLDTPEQSQLIIDPRGAVDERALVLDYSYDAAVASVTKLLNPEQLQKQRAQKEGRTEQAERRREPAFERLAVPPAITRGLGRVGQAMERSPSAFAEELGKAQIELGRVAELVHREFEDVVQAMVTITTQGSVLVSLSLQDQISELEKISLGIDESAFDDDHMRVVRQEVSALYRLSRYSVPPEEAGRFLAVRDKRLAEVKQKLDLMGKPRAIAVQQSR